MNVILIGFYNPKALGVRYLEQALRSGGHDVKIVFFKNFNSVRPKPATETELSLLRELVESYKPGLIGLSVMASLYMETVDAVNDTIRSHFDTPVVWGGAYPSLFPRECLERCDYVIRGEGEEAIIELADALQSQAPVNGILNLAYLKDGSSVVNDLRMLSLDLDKYGLPDIGGDNKFLIDGDTIRQIDPQLTAVSYETGAGRGCPFTCTYCSSINLHRMNSGKGPYVRFRDVDMVIEELKMAKTKMKRLVVVHFWDEIFSDDSEWVDRFARRYKEEIGLPFEIWGHPLRTNHKLTSRLREAGLYKVVMGIQSGSPHIRKDVFRRPESQEAILAAARVLKDCRVPQIIYDFMLRHPFETHDTIRETFELCLRLPFGYELQMHGLNFLPGTDIVDMAIKQGLVSPEEMQEMMLADMERQYSAHWQRDNHDPVMNFWFHLIYLTQYRVYRKTALKLARDPLSPVSHKKAERAYQNALKLEKPRYYKNKLGIVLRGLFLKG